MTNNAPRVLIVDDDPAICLEVSQFLNDQGCVVVSAHSSEEMETHLKNDDFDVLILDLRMPGEGGLSICRRLSERPAGPFILVYSAMAEDVDRIVALEIGADDCLDKYSRPRELLARIKALARRRRSVLHPGRPSAAALLYRFDGWKLHLGRREVRRTDGELVDLTAKEFALLWAFVQRPRTVLSRTMLVDLMMEGGHGARDRNIDVSVSRLRAKLRDAEPGSDLIQTQRSFGYIFTAKVQSVH